MKAFIFALLFAFVLSKPVGSPKAEKVVYYNQADKPWGTEYWSVTKDPKLRAEQTYRKSACGPTSMAMVVATLVGRVNGKKVTPLTLGKFALDNNLRTENNGPKKEFFPKAAKKYNLEYNKTLNVAAALDEISKDKDGVNVLGIALMKKGYWTGSGHFIMVYDTKENGDPWVFDPGHRTRVTQPRNEFISECNFMMLFSKPKPKDEAATEEVDSSLNKIKDAEKTEELPTEEKEAKEDKKEEEKKDCKDMTATQSVNVRKGPATTYKIVQVLEKGQTVCAKDPVDNWCEVPGLGYVSGKYLSGSGVTIDSGSSSTSDNSGSTGDCKDKDIYSKISRKDAIEILKRQVSYARNKREKTVTAAKYLAYSFTGLPYFGQGGHGYDSKGDFDAVFNPNWGKCKKLKISTSRYQKVGSYYNYGLDCSGYINWAVFQSGKRTDNTANNWAAKGKQLDIKNHKDSRIKVGDLVWKPGHIGMIIDKKDSVFIIAEEGGASCGLRYEPITKNSSHFTKIVLMDNFY